MRGSGRANEIPLLRIPQVRFGDCEASEAPESVEQRWAEEERKRFALGAAPSMGRWCRHPWCQAQVPKVEDQLGPTPRKTTRRPGEVQWEMADFSVTTQSTPQSTPGRMIAGLALQVAYRLFCDGGILDGFQAERRVRRAGLQSPFAVGQLVNHPPQGIEANVQILEISEPLDETWAVSRLHQGLWYLDRTWSPVNVPQGRAHGAMRAPTVAMEALRELRVGEELF